MLRTTESFISKQIWEQQFLRTTTRHVEYVKHENNKKQQKLGLLEQVLSNYFDENREETAKPCSLHQ